MGARPVRLAPDGDGPHRGVLLLHAWWGRSAGVLALAEGLARAGSVVVVPDLFDGAVARTPEEAERLIAGVDAARAARAADGAADALAADPAVAPGDLGVVALSYGAGLALRLAAARERFRAVVLYYGSGEVPAEWVAPARILCHDAADDPFEPADWTAEFRALLRARGNAVAEHAYPGTGHWFAEADRPDAYDDGAAALALERTLRHLRAV